MTTTITVEITPQGLLIPRTSFQDWGEIEVIQEEHRIIIQPKSLSSSYERELVTQALREDDLLVEMVNSDPLSPPVTSAERAKLAQKLSKGQLLSELVIKERREGW